MAIEIEKKFLLKNDSWRQSVFEVRHIKQGYLNNPITEGAKSSLRIRIEDNKANINIKSLVVGISRHEYQVDMPLEDATEILNKMAINSIVVKNRHLVKYANMLWEIDEFLADNHGLIVAEVELQAENQAIELPDWIGKEVTNEKKYYNGALSINPFSNWQN